jgi:hypothetical protein
LRIISLGLVEREIMKQSLKFVVLLICLFTCVTVVSAARTGPIYISNAGGGGTETCAMLGQDIPGFDCTGIVQYKTPSSPGSGHYTDGSFVVDITITGTGPYYVAWTSNLPVKAVITKDGGPWVNAYTYDPGVMSDSGLEVPQNPAGAFGGISHISFCYSPGIPTPEFPTMVLPAGLLIGIFGAVLFIQRTKED